MYDPPLLPLATRGRYMHSRRLLREAVGGTNAAEPVRASAATVPRRALAARRRRPVVGVLLLSMLDRICCCCVMPRRAASLGPVAEGERLRGGARWSRPTMAGTRPCFGYVGKGEGRRV